VIEPRQSAPQPSGTTAPHSWRAIDWPAHTHRRLLADGTEISYVDIGAGPGATLLLVHGLGGSWEAWIEVIPAWAKDHRVIAIDLPGFGVTQARKSTYTIDEYSAIVESLCAALDLGAVVAVGSSMGGWISAQLALDHPDRVHMLVLVDAAGIYPTPRERRKVVRILRLAARVAPFGCRHRDRILRSPRLRARALAFAFVAPQALPVDLVEKLMPVTPSPVFGSVLTAAVAKWSPVWTDRVRHLEMPTLVVWGELDNQLPLRHGREWARLLPHGRLVTVPGAGHLPMIEAPAAVGGAVLSFVENG
jgi:pimeloyl-ACP methyl ester carboxylesterase